MSDAARQLDDLESMDARVAMNLASVVRNPLEELRETYPDVEIETDIPPEAYVLANDLLTSVVDNLLRNAIEHNDGQPRLRITVESADPSSEFVGLRIRDNGPGFSENELEVHARETGTDLRHSDGVGLWLARWTVDFYDGEVALENAPDGGAIVTVKLPPVR